MYTNCCNKKKWVHDFGGDILVSICIHKYVGVKQKCSAVLEKKFKQIIGFTIYILEHEVTYRCSRQYFLFTEIVVVMQQCCHLLDTVEGCFVFCPRFCRSCVTVFGIVFT